MSYGGALSEDRILIFISQRLEKVEVVFLFPLKMMHSNQLFSMLKECCQKSCTLMSPICSVACI